jgi:hypothetical protein
MTACVYTNEAMTENLTFPQAMVACRYDESSRRG